MAQFVRFWITLSSSFDLGQQATTQNTLEMCYKNMLAITHLIYTTRSFHIYCLFCKEKKESQQFCREDVQMCQILSINSIMKDTYRDEGTNYQYMKKKLELKCRDAPNVWQPKLFGRKKENKNHFRCSAEQVKSPNNFLPNNKVFDDAVK